MKKPVLFAIGIMLLSSATMFAATAIKLLTLGTAVYNDTVKIIGIPVTAIQNDANGFSVEVLPGLTLISVLLGLTVFALTKISSRLAQNKVSRY
jgi:hypothetical protein